MPLHKLQGCCIGHSNGICAPHPLQLALVFLYHQLASILYNTCTRSGPIATCTACVSNGGGTYVSIFLYVVVVVVVCKRYIILYVANSAGLLA